jgi:hypothetical protein
MVEMVVMRVMENGDHELKSVLEKACGLQASNVTRQIELRVRVRGPPKRR